jgi:hypothetical protein
LDRFITSAIATVKNVRKEEAEEAYLTAVCIAAAVKAIECMESESVDIQPKFDAETGEPISANPTYIGDSPDEAEWLPRGRLQAALASQAVSHVVLKSFRKQIDRMSDLLKVGLYGQSSIFSFNYRPFGLLFCIAAPPLGMADYVRLQLMLVTPRTQSQL